MPTEEQLEVQRLESLVGKLTLALAQLEAQTGRTAKEVWLQQQFEDANRTAQRILDKRREDALVRRLEQSRGLYADLRALDEQRKIARRVVEGTTSAPVVRLEDSDAEEVCVVEVLINASTFHTVRAQSWNEAAKIALARPVPSAGREVVLGDVTGCTVYDVTGERMDDCNESGE